MKKIMIKILLALVIGHFSLVIALEQTFKELKDSTIFYYNKDDYVKSLAFGQKSLDLAEKEYGKDTNYCSVLKYVSDNYKNLNQIDNALNTIREDSILTLRYYGEKNTNYISVLFRLSNLYLSLARFPEAESILLRALELAKEGYTEESNEYYQVMSTVVLLYFTMHQNDKGEPYLTRAIELSKKLFGEISEEYSTQLQNRTSYYLSLGKYKESIAINEKVLSIRQSLFGENSKEYASTLNQAGLLYKRLGQLQLADSMYLKVLEIYKKTLPENHFDFAGIYNDLAILYENMGRFEESEEYFKKALEILKISYGERHPDYARTLNGYASLLEHMDKINLAETIFLKALEIYKEVLGEEDEGYATVLNNLALLYNDVGRVNEAINLAEKVAGIFKKKLGENHEYYATILNNMATFKNNEDKYQEAEELNRKAIEIIKNKFGESHPQLSYPYSNLSLTLQRMGRYEEAESLLNDDIKISIKNYGENNRYIPLSLSNRSLLKKEMGKYDDFEKDIFTALEMSNMIMGEESRLSAQIMSILGQHYFYKCEFYKAETYLKKSIEIRTKIFGENYLNSDVPLMFLGMVYNLTGREKEAIPILEKALELSRIQNGENSTSFMSALFNIGIAIGRDSTRVDEAQKLLDKGMNIMITSFQKQLPYMNEQQKIRFWDRMAAKINNFNVFVNKYHKLKPELTEKMLDFTLATKGISLNSTQKALSKVRQSRRLLEDWQNTRQFWLNLVQNPQKTKKMGINVDSVAQAAENLERQLSGQSIEFKKAFDTTRVRWRDVQQKLNSDEAAIEIVRNSFMLILNDTLITYTMIITKKDSKYPELVILNNGRELENKYIIRYAGILEKQKKSGKLLKDDYAELGDIYNNFWQPVAEKLNGINTVYISLEGVYNQFNLNTLFNPVSNKYLLDEIDLRIVTSTRDLANNELNLHNTAPVGTYPKPGTAKLFGAPEFDLKKEVKKGSNNKEDSEIKSDFYLGRIFEQMARKGIAPLPGTKIEVKKIAADFEDKNWKVDDFIGDAALEENIKNSRNPRILHIATHGVFLKDVEYLTDDFNSETKKYAENPLLRSMLLFSGAANTIKGESRDDIDKDDGILTAYEAMNLDLDETELVVLSACQTGLGEVRNGEGVYGLQRAFQVAGAKSLIMSLWSVSDKATQELMTSFYSKWLSGKTKREAFREAQMELKQKYPGFYYWGAFVMLGE